MEKAGMKVNRLTDVLWEIPAVEKKGGFKMNVPARFYATEKLFKELDDGAVEQITNVACLPGIQEYAIAMPDAHFGYGMPVGGVAVFDLKEGVISPGGIGFDINCGMRFIRTELSFEDVKPKIKELTNELFRLVPAGVSCKGLIRFTEKELREVMTEGAKWCVGQGYGFENDFRKIESSGMIRNADPSKVSKKAVTRGVGQLGTLGSGNHYLEVQVINKDSIFDLETAKAFGMEKEGQIGVMVHCGSRGFGHQICTDYLGSFDQAMKKYSITLPDRQLACAPFESEECQDYFKAMACASNFAFANRQMITHQIREAFKKVFHQSPEKLGLDVVYDVGHNTAKIEEYKVQGKRKKLIVHRKGATRAFGPGNDDLPPEYSKTGQPVIIGGSMETGSYLLAGTKEAEEESFGSTCHGSGRTMSRAKAKNQVRGETLQRDMEEKGIYVKAASMPGLAEEAGFAYKDLEQVVDTLEIAGITKRVVKMSPIANVKGAMNPTSALVPLLVAIIFGLLSQLL